MWQGIGLRLFGQMQFELCLGARKLLAITATNMTCALQADNYWLTTLCKVNLRNPGRITASNASRRPTAATIPA